MSTTPDARVLELYAQETLGTEAAAYANFQSMMDESPWLGSLHLEVQAVLDKGGSPRAILARMRKLADRIASAVAPHIACQKGCSACCHIAVTVTDVEAKMIGHDIGRAPNKVTIASKRTKQSYAQTRDQHNLDYFGIPCPFLGDTECSIYAARPLACRLHVNLGSSAFFCSTDISPEYSVVPRLNLSMFWVGLASAMPDAGVYDIREFW